MAGNPILEIELTVDELNRGYAGMSDRAAADDLNTVYRDDPNPPTSVFAAALWNAFDPTEYGALSVENKVDMDYIGGLGSDIQVSSGLIKNKVFAVFGVASVSRANIIALTTAPQVSRGVELGLGQVGEGDVWDVRNGN